MQTKLFMGLALAVVALGLSSCDDASKLAENVQGTWKGETTQMTKSKPEKHKDDKGDRKDGRRDKAMMDVTCTPTFTFTLEKGTNGGNLAISAQYTVAQPVFTKDETAAPVKATISGTATASGTWMAKDDDDITVTLDPAKTNVTVDPASLKLDYAVLTDRPASELDSIKANIAANIEPQVKSMLQERISNLRKFDDVKFINPTTMKMEVGHAKITFTKE